MSTRTLFVDVSSPSSSAFDSVEDLGPPEQAAKRTLDQVLYHSYCGRMKRAALPKVSRLHTNDGHSVQFQPGRQLPASEVATILWIVIIFGEG